MLSNRAVGKVLDATSNDKKLVLVGGQAILFWVSRFAHAPEFHDDDVPLASEDIDYVGNVRSAKKLSMIIGGELRVPKPDDHTPNTATLDTTIDGEDVHIDFLASVQGIPREIEKHAIDFRLKPDSEKPDLRVMHPLHCLISKVANATTLGRTDLHAQTQLEATPVILREYISELLDGDPDGKGREASRVLMQLGHYLETNIEGGRDAHLIMKRDPLNVLKIYETDQRLDPRFRTKQIGAAIDRISNKRVSRARRTAQSS